MARARVQAPEIDGPVALRSPGMPGDTFTGAAQAPINNDLTRIADALSGFNSALQGFGSAALKQKQAEAAAAEAARVEGRLAQQSPADVIAYRKSPDYQPVLDPHVRGVEANRYGFSHARQIGAGLDADIAAGKINLGDPNTDATKLLQERAAGVVADIDQTYATDAVSRKLAQEGFRKEIDGYYGTYAKRALDIRSAQLVEANTGSARQLFNESLAAGVVGSDPNTTLRMWNTVTRDMGPSGSANLPLSTLKSLKLDVLENAAADPEKAKMIEPLLNSKVLGNDGKTILPALAEDGSVLDQVRRIRETAKKTFAKDWSNKENSGLESAALDAIRKQDGSESSIQPQRKQNAITGEWETVGVNARTDAARRYFTWSQEDLAKGRDPSIVLDREVKVAQRNNMTVPHLKEQLNDAVPSVMDGSFASNYQNREKVLGAYDKWRNITRENRTWAESKLELSKQTREFYDTMDIATGAMGLPADKALDLAADIVRNPMSQNEPDKLNRKLAEVQSQTAKVASDGGWLRSIFNNETPYNSGFVVNRVGEVASVLAKSGQVDPEMAVKLAKEHVQKTVFTVNGSAVPSVPNMSETDARSTIEKRIDTLLPDIQKRFDYKVIKKSDIAVYDNGDGSYGLRDKRYGLEIRLPTKDGEGNEFRGAIRWTANDLVQQRDLDKKTAEDRTVADGRRNARDALFKAHEDLDKRQQGLDASGLGGVFRQTQQSRIDAERRKLEPKPDIPAWMR